MAVEAESEGEQEDDDESEDESSDSLDSLDSSSTSLESDSSDESGGKNPRKASGELKERRVPLEDRSREELLQVSFYLVRTELALTHSRSFASLSCSRMMQ